MVPASGADGAEAQPATAAWTPSQRAALSLSYLGYATCMLCKSAFDLSIPSIQLDATMALTHEATARMLSAGASAYMLGKLVGGSLSDIMGGGRTLAFTSIVTAAAFGVIVRARSLSALTVAWVLARLFMASGYPAGTAIVGEHFEGTGLGLALGIFSTSSRGGAVLGSVVLGTLLSPTFGISWRGVLGLGGALSLGVGAAVQFHPALRRSRPESQQLPADAGSSGEADLDRVITKTAAEGILALCKTGRLWLTMASTACLGPAFEFGAVLPLCLTSTHGMTPAVAAVMSGFYPLGAAVSLIVSGWLYDRLKPKQRAAYFGSLLLMAAGSLSLLTRSAGRPKWMLATCLFTTMFGVAPALCESFASYTFSV